MHGCKCFRFRKDYILSVKSQSIKLITWCAVTLKFIFIISEDSFEMKADFGYGSHDSASTL